VAERQRPEEFAGRQAARLGAGAPRARVIDDAGRNAFTIGHGRRATVVFTVECYRSAT
jgi:Zn-dependent protease with chaperone function